MVIFKQIGLLLILVLSLLTLNACEDDIDDVSTEINIWVMPNFSNPQKDTEQLVKGFELENPGVKVNVTILDWSSAWTKITMAASAQNGPDVVQMPTTWAATLTEMGYLMSLDTIMEMIGGEERFIDVAMETARPRASDSITSMPWFIDIRPFFYRKDVLSAIGVEKEALKNRSDLYTVLKMILDEQPVIEKKLVMPIGFPGKNDWNIIHNFSPWIWGSGGSILTQDGLSSNIASPKSIDGIMFYLNMIKEGFNEKRNLEKNTAQVSLEFDGGGIAFWQDAGNKLTYLQRPAFLETHSSQTSATIRNYGVMLPPTGPVGKKDVKYFVGGSNLSIFTFSKNKEMAGKLLQYLSGRQDVQMKMARMSGFMPTLKTSYDSPYFLRDPNRKIFVNLVKNGITYPSVHYWGEIETSILLRRFGNIFDLITSSSKWPYKKILSEIKATDKEINDYINSQISDRPELVKRLKDYAKKKGKHE